MERARDDTAFSNPTADTWPEGGAARLRNAGTPAADAGRTKAKPRSGGRRAKADRRDRSARDAKPRTPAKRFAEPYQFDDKQRAAIDHALAEAGIDDPSGRAIFIGAIAYDVAALVAALEARPHKAPEPVREALQLTHEPPVEPAPTPERATNAVDHKDLAALAQAAEQLGKRLSALDDASRTRLIGTLSTADPFARGYGPDYLAAVALEIARIAACAAAAGKEAAAPEASARAAAAEVETAIASKPRPKPASRPKGQPPHPAALHFIQHAARVYEEAFDLKPTTRAHDPFARGLAAIGKATGLPIPTRVADLKQALAASDL